MQVLKWIGYTIVSIIGLCVLIAIGAILAAIGSAIGVIMIGAGAVFLVAFMISECLENTKDRGT